MIARILRMCNCHSKVKRFKNIKMVTQSVTLGAVNPTWPISDYKKVWPQRVNYRLSHLGRKRTNDPMDLITWQGRQNSYRCEPLSEQIPISSPSLESFRIVAFQNVTTNAHYRCNYKLALLNPWILISNTWSRVSMQKQANALSSVHISPPYFTIRDQ